MTLFNDLRFEKIPFAPHLFALLPPAAEYLEPFGFWTINNVVRGPCQNDLIIRSQVHCYGIFSNNDMLSKTYNAKDHEDHIYDEWQASGYFDPDKLPGERKESFTISMPPPNVTGRLHMGHAMMLAIQDVMIRFNRMRGKKTLWVPGLDHASIATQNVVEQRLWKEEKKTRHDLGREEFLKRVDVFVQESKSIIRSQIKKMGTSCDWSRERYTLDEGLSRAVQTVFVKMYEDGLIYRGDRIVNWCTHCQTTLADDEVVYKEERTPFYYFKFGPFTIATVRPETKVQDKVVIVHPKDKRYKKFHGTTQMIPWIDGEVKMHVIADEAADMEMGSGAMTITPAHSFVDFELAQKYKVPIINIIGMDGKLTSAAGTYAGMEVREARKKFVDVLQEKGLVEKIDENYVHNVSLCYRCDTPIEPLVSKQWFVAVDKKPASGGSSLKRRSLDVVKKQKIEFVPDRFEKAYVSWMENLHDWCISRQLWFGHRIPVWYKRDPNIQMRPNDPNVEVETYVGIESPKGDGWEQDPDTLDTWFSSGLWTFSTLGWPFDAATLGLSSGRRQGKPKKGSDLATFHPTTVMETGYDILPLWVARMIMMTTYVLKEIPFRYVYLHGLVLDKNGKKMSKSKGNGIDPLDIIATYGADSARLSLLIGATPGNDVRLSEEKIAGFRNFVNKLWNIGRFVLTQEIQSSNYRDPFSVILQRTGLRSLTLTDRWIISRMQQVIESVTKDIEEFRFSQAGETLRQFTWGDFADWYLEIKKIEGDANSITQSIFAGLLKLWHPFTPYVTEVLWKEMQQDGLLMIEKWPESDDTLRDKTAEAQFGHTQEVIGAIRRARAAFHVPPTEKLDAIVVTQQTVLETERLSIERLARCAPCRVCSHAERPATSIVVSVGKTIVYLTVGAAVDLNKERARIEQEAKEKMKYVLQLEQRLTNEDFTKNAPHDIVAEQQKKWEAAREELTRLRELTS